MTQEIKYAIHGTNFKKGDLLGYDITEKQTPREITFSDDFDGYIQCDAYDYLLSWRQFLLGVSQGWIQL